MNRVDIEEEIFGNLASDYNYINIKYKTSSGKVFEGEIYKIYKVLPGQRGDEVVGEISDYDIVIEVPGGITHLGNIDFIHEKLNSGNIKIIRESKSKKDIIELMSLPSDFRPSKIFMGEELIAELKEESATSAVAAPEPVPKIAESPERSQQRLRGPPKPPSKPKQERISDAEPSEYKEFVEKCIRDPSSKLMMTVITQHSSIISGQFLLPSHVKHFFKGTFNKPTLAVVTDADEEFKNMTKFNIDLQKMLNNKELFMNGCPNLFMLLHNHPATRGKAARPGYKTSDILDASFQLYEDGHVNEMLLEWVGQGKMDFWNKFGLLFYSMEMGQSFYLKLSDVIIAHDDPKYCPTDSDGNLLEYKICISSLYANIFKQLQVEIGKPIIFYFNTCRVLGTRSGSGMELSRTTSLRNDRSKDCFKRDYESTFDDLGIDDGLKSAIFEKIDAYDNMSEFYNAILEEEADKEIVVNAILGNDKERLVEHIKLCFDKKFTFPPVGATSEDTSVSAPPVGTQAVDAQAVDAQAVDLMSEDKSQRVRFKSSRTQKLEQKLEEVRKRMESQEGNL